LCFCYCVGDSTIQELSDFTIILEHLCLIIKEFACRAVAVGLRK